MLQPLASLNAVPPQSGEVDRSNVDLSLDHPQKLMQVGVSQDFTLLQGHHNEKKCSNFANKSDGGLCREHTTR